MKTGQYLLGFNFFLLKPDSFGRFWSILKEVKAKSKTFRQYEETFVYLASPRLLEIYIFLFILVLKKTHLPSKLIFRAAEMQKIKQLNLIYIKKCLFDFIIEFKFGTKNRSRYNTIVFMTVFTFGNGNWSLVQFPKIFREAKAKRNILNQSREIYFDV